MIMPERIGIIGKTHGVNASKNPNTKNEKIAFQIKNSNSVSIHIRRGDLLYIDNVMMLELDYYISCIEN